MSALRIAIIGAGAAGMYAVGHLLEQSEFEVAIDVIESLPTPWGLVRNGVAPDHPEKKLVADRLFEFFLGHDSVRFLGNVKAGQDISHDELTQNYDAVIYATGATDDKPLGIPGEQLRGSWSAREFVAWYNGDPDCKDLDFDLSAERAVVVGTGNVALDVARILTLDVEELGRTDIADHALATLRASRVREVVVLGRRGCRDAAFHNPELEELLHLERVEVRIEANDLAAPREGECDWATRRKLETMLQLQARVVPAPRRRITFKFQHTPLGVTGLDRVGGIAVQGRDGSSVIGCGLLLRAIGYRGSAISGLPFDRFAGLVPNVEGRIADNATPQTGVYVTGWIKRGPRGVIGSNKRCAAETVACLLADARAGILKRRHDVDVEQILAEREVRVVPYRGWQRIDAAERTAGRTHGRPRLKQTVREELLTTAAASGP